MNAATVIELVASFAFPVLAAATGLAAGVLLLGTTTAGFHDLAGLRAGRLAKAVRLSPQTP